MTAACLLGERTLYVLQSKTNGGHPDNVLVLVQENSKPDSCLEVMGWGTRCEEQPQG
jgi:hypothetical protein